MIDSFEKYQIMSCFLEEDWHSDLWTSDRFNSQALTIKVYYLFDKFVVINLKSVVGFIKKS